MHFHLKTKTKTKSKIAAKINTGVIEETEGVAHLLKLTLQLHESQSNKHKH